jgi:hypothetical protein
MDVHAWQQSQSQTHGHATHTQAVACKYRFQHALDRTRKFHFKICGDEAIVRTRNRMSANIVPKAKAYHTGGWPKDCPRIRAVDSLTTTKRVDVQLVRTSDAAYLPAASRCSCTTWPDSTALGALCIGAPDVADADVTAADAPSSARALLLLRPCSPVAATTECLSETRALPLRAMRAPPTAPLPASDPLGKSVGSQSNSSNESIGLGMACPRPPLRLLMVVGRSCELEHMLKISALDHARFSSLLA